MEKSKRKEEVHPTKPLEGPWTVKNLLNHVFFKKNEQETSATHALESRDVKGREKLDARSGKLAGGPRD